MTDEILQELWNTKDDIAKEHAYNLDDLAEYYRKKQTTRLGRFHQETTNTKAEQGTQLLNTAAENTGKILGRTKLSS